MTFRITTLFSLRQALAFWLFGALVFPALGQLDTTINKFPLSYNEYLALVGKNNLGYIAQQFTVGIAEAGIEMAKIFPDPQLNYGAYDIGQERMRMGYGFTTGIGTTLELGGKRRARINLAQSQTELTKVLLQNYFKNLRADATDAFLQALKQENIFRVKINSYLSMKQLATSDSIRFMLGSIMEIDSRQTKVEARSKLNEAFQSEADWKASMLQLGMMIGKQRTDTLYYAEGGFSKFDREFILVDLITTAENERSDLLAALKNKEVSQRILELAKARRVIDLGISMGVSSTSVVTVFVAPTPSFSTVFGGVNIPLRFSNKYTGELKAAEYNIKQSEILYQQVELQIQTEVTQAYFNYLAVRKQVRQFNTGLLDEARKVFEGKVYSYQRGKTSLLEVLNAQRTYNDVRQSYYETLFNYAVALVELERAVGIWDIDF
jgi:cobalt-zinc-cadmium efflux system outer membrane protein